LHLSGHRLGGFNDNFHKIGEYLNQRTAQMLSIPYRKEDTDEGRKHIYRICYIDVELLKGITVTGKNIRHIFMLKIAMECD
jgi:hypothetical protein